jgi:hypothetical protein
VEKVRIERPILAAAGLLTPPKAAGLMINSFEDELIITKMGR